MDNDKVPGVEIHDISSAITLLDQIGNQGVDLDRLKDNLRHYASDGTTWSEANQTYTPAQSGVVLHRWEGDPDTDHPLYQFCQTLLQDSEMDLRTKSKIRLVASDSSTHVQDSYPSVIAGYDVVISRGRKEYDLAAGYSRRGLTYDTSKGTYVVHLVKKKE